MKMVINKDKLLELMLAKEYDRWTLSKKAGISYSTINNVLSGKSASLISAKAISKALGVKAKDLFTAVE